MKIHARRHFPSLWPVALVSTLALAPGCSGDREEESELTPVLNERGILTYRYASAGTSPPASSTSPIFVPGQQDKFSVQNQQPQQNEPTYQDVRRDFEDRLRREQQEQQAYEETRRQYEEEQHRRQREQERVYQQQQREAREQQRRWAQAEALQRQRAERELDASLQRLFPQQQPMTFPHQRWGR
jgi:hypothetical protein